MPHPLNEFQREAVRHLDGPLLVLAGAGSGKTRVITHKIAYLIEECGVPARHIAAITFTNKAAREMQERVGKALGGERAQAVNVSTFHALGARILRQESRRIGLKPGFSILDASDTEGLYRDLLPQVDKVQLRILQGRISLWKNGLIEPEAAAATAADEAEATAARLYVEYERSLRAYQAVDFDDLIRLPVRLLAEDGDVLADWQGRLRYLLIDEYQDTNRSQYRLLRLLAGMRAAFTAVGDDDQSIYAWRGADAENLRLLADDYPLLKIVKLEQNYRSTTRILKAANALIAHNPKIHEKRLWSERGHGDVIQVSACRDGEHEAELVTARLLAHRMETRGKWADYAVLYRGNHQSRAFEQLLRENNVPYKLSGGQSFFERAEIKDITAYLRLLGNSDDDPAFIRAVTTPKRGIGAATLEALGRYAGGRQISLFAAMFEAGATTALPPRQLEPLQEFGRFINRFGERAGREAAGQVATDLLAAIGYESWLFDTLDPGEAETKQANVRDFIAWLGRKGEADNKSLLALVQTIALIGLLEKDQDDGDAVQLATLHAAKGLEFRHVFLVGVEEGVLPHRDSLAEEKLHEERRLMYVGITRAQMSLHLSWCKRRKQGRDWRECEPSRFIAELGDDIKFSGGESEVPADRAAGRAKLQQFRALLNGAGKPPGAA